MAKKLGGGGNGNVFAHTDDTVIKKLRNPGNRERLARFEVEIEAQQAAISRGVKNVVPILEYNLDPTNAWYTMPMYDGDLNEIRPFSLARDYTPGTRIPSITE